MKKTKGELQKLIDSAYNIFKKIEWNGTTSGPSSRMGYDDGPDVDCCPACGGIDPDDDCADVFVNSAVGHKRSCPIKKFLTNFE